MNRTPERRQNARPDVASTADYQELLDGLKQRIRAAHTRAAAAVNTELVMLNWWIGREILMRQQALGWGDEVVGRISTDLRTDGAGGRGFSRRNLFYMRRFAALWPDEEKVSALIGWSQHRELLDAFGDQPGAAGNDRYSWATTSSSSTCSSTTTACAGS